jgi:carboxypeptidase Q
MAPSIVVGVIFGIAGIAAEGGDLDTIARIKIEAFQRSQVMDTLGWLTDVYGPRLSGSPALKDAADWTRDRLARWGVQGATLEPYPDRGRGWTVKKHSAEMLAPRYASLVAYPRAWTPSTAGVVTGSPIFTEVLTRSDFGKYKGKLRGAIVFNGKPAPSRSRFEPEARRLTDDDLRRRAEQLTPTAAGFNGPASLKEEDEEWAKSLEERKAVQQFFAEEGVAALVEPSRFDQLVVETAGNYDHVWQATYPAFVMAREHYGRVMRLLERKVPVTLSVNLETEYHDGPGRWFNIVGEIPGSDAKVADEVVMLGAHFDSWHAATGATDNAAGCAVMMEAMRILQSLGLKPRRTIRIALWTGEEQDYFGSRAYVEQHFSPLNAVAPKPEYAKLAAYFNLDNGTGKIRGVNLQGNEAVRPIFEAWLAPFHYLGATTVTTLSTGGTDHMPFDAVGLPAFQFIQDPVDYNSETHHTNTDLFEAILEDDLKQASAIVASFAWQAAMHDRSLPRKPR